MWPFKKKKIIDLTEKKISRPSTDTNTEEYKDLTKENSGSVLGFLGKLASSSTSPTDTDIATTNEMPLKHLKVKIEDIEYKIQNLMKKIDSVIDRVDLAEKRLDRVDRR
jgi:hypothetical protein